MLTPSPNPLRRVRLLPDPTVADGTGPRTVARLFPVNDRATLPLPFGHARTLRAAQTTATHAPTLRGQPVG
jgi:hypothetical protein